MCISVKACKKTQKLWFGCVSVGREKRKCIMFRHTAPRWRGSELITHKRSVPAFQGAGALLPPGPPQQEAQQVQHEHGGLRERAEERLVVVLSLENVLREESTGGRR